MKNNYQTRILKKLANLQFAIGLLFTIGFLSAIGTIIEQNQTLTFYKENYPENNPLLGLITWKVITFLNLDTVYTSWWFLTILFLFVSSLLACTLTTQLPSLKTFKLWKFITKPKQFQRLVLKEKLNQKLNNVLAYTWNENNYNIFRQGKKSYGYSGLLGRLAPVAVHGSIVLLLFGTTIGSFGGYVAQEIIPRGEVVHLQNILNAGQFSYIPQEISCRINDFWITYTEESKIDQFYSDVSLLDDKGLELKRKTIFVNEPLFYKGLTFYQTDWDLLGLKLNLNGNNQIQIPLKKIKKNGKKFWFASFDKLNKNQTKLSFVINDLQGNVSIYDNKGALIQNVELGQTFKQNGEELQITEVISSTGLQIKADPGLATVYFSFLVLMLSIYASFLTYSQIWVVQNNGLLKLGGKSNRAVLYFQEEFRRNIKKTQKQVNIRK